MLHRLANNQDPDSFASRLRRRRFAFFSQLLARVPGTLRILDVGGTRDFWQQMGADVLRRAEITLVNLNPDPVSAPGMTSVQGDARALPFAPASFDVVFSNSVIEHVGGLADQTRMAAEVMRVGQRFFIQTPNRYFPIEPHFLMPFFQFYPVALRVALVRRFRLGWLPRTPDKAKAREAVEGVRLLNRRELASMFPGAGIYEERLAGMTKSFVAYGGWPAD